MQCKAAQHLQQLLQVLHSGDSPRAARHARLCSPLRSWPALCEARADRRLHSGAALLAHLRRRRPRCLQALAAAYNSRESSSARACESGVGSVAKRPRRCDGACAQTKALHTTRAPSRQQRSELLRGLLSGIHCEQMDNTGVRWHPSEHLLAQHRKQPYRRSCVFKPNVHDGLMPSIFGCGRMGFSVSSF